MAWHIVEARFVSTYGAEMLRYRGDLTTDGYIPWKLYALFVATMSTVWAGDALNQIRGLSVALAGAFGDKQAGRRIRQLVKEAEGGR